MSEIPHRIFRQQWRVSATSDKQAFTLRKQLHEQWEETLLPIFDKAFGECASGEDILYFPKLEIELKVSDDKELWNELSDKLYSQLSEILKSELPKTGSPSAGHSDGIKIPVSQHRFDILLHYLQSGNLPRYSSSDVNKITVDLAATIHDQWWQLVDFINGNRASQPFLFRLFQILSFGEIIQLTEDLIRHLSIGAKKELNLLLFGLLHSGDSRFNRHTGTMLAAAFLHAAIHHRDQTTIPGWEEAAGRLIPTEQMMEVRKFVHTVTGSSQLISTDFRQANDFAGADGKQGVIEKSLCNPMDTGEINANFEEQRENNGAIYAENTRNLAEAVFAETAGPVALQTGLIKNSQIRVQNAGLLLLHPFIGRLFVNCGIIMEKEKEIPFQKRSNAAALLHYLATGRDEIFEFELGFIKVLLGLDPDSPLAVSQGILNKEQKEEAESLLLSVVGHWSSLKNTTPNGLRSSFIQRNGLLQSFEEDWKIQLESTAFDVLLQTIPWSFSIIRLPWMKKTIFTECQTN